MLSVCHQPANKYQEQFGQLLGARNLELMGDMNKVPVEIRYEIPYDCVVMDGLFGSHRQSRSRISCHVLWLDHLPTEL